MRRIKLFSLIQERVTRQMCPSRWSARRRVSWPLSVATELLETRCLLSAGDLDPSFGTGGIVTTSGSGASSVAIQSDGKIIVSGGGDNGGFTLARFNANGSLDTTFDRDGKLTTDFGLIVGGAFSVAIQSDGKIVAAGGNNDFALARYNTNGSLDTSFDGDGKLTTDFGTPTDRAFSVAVQSDGKIVAVGQSESGFAVARYNKNGSLDTSFNGTGMLTTTFNSSSDVAASVAIQSDGKIVVAGTTFHAGTGYDFALARFNSDGSLDTMFGDDGKQIANIPGGFANSVVIQSDEKIVVAGSAIGGGSSAFGVARFESDGSLDNSFDNDGTLTTDFSDVDDRGLSVALQQNGKIVVAGWAADGIDFALARYNENGSLDSTFDGDGTLTMDFGSQLDRAFGVAVQNDGRIVVAGSGNGTIGNISVARYIGDTGPTAVIALPVQGSAVEAFLVSGELHLRRSRNAPDLVAPFALSNIESIRFDGTANSDRITLDHSMSAFHGSIIFNGGDGNDSLNAKAVGINITFNGGDDNDTFLGGSGNDSVNGGSGDDSLTGGNGNDSIHGGADNDRITGDAGNDVLVGGTGDDSLRGGNGNDTLLGDAGRDTLNGESGNDLIDGGDDNDNLQGSDGNDSLRGGNGNDTIQGGNGSDILIGSAGNDSLKGDAGVDTLLGGSGNDTMDGGTSKDLINPGSGTDKITDSSYVIDASFAFDFDRLLAGLGVL